MTQQYDNEMRGVLFVNTNRQKESQPNWKGEIQIGGMSYWLSGWDRNTKKGDCISISVTEKQTAASAYSAQPKVPAPLQSDPDFSDEEIPF